MPKTIDIPGVGSIDFPDGMSDDDISSASQKLYQQSKGTSKPTPSQPSSSPGIAQRYAQQGPVTRVEPQPTSFKMQFNSTPLKKPAGIYAAPPPSQPNAFMSGLEKVGSVLSAPANAVKALAQPATLALQNAVVHNGYGADTRYPSDVTEQKRVAGLPLRQRMQAVSGQDLRTLGQPMQAQQNENAYQHLPALGKVVSSIGKFGVDLGTDPMTWLLGGTAGAADSMMSKLGDLYQAAKNPVLKQAAKNAVNVIAKYSPVIQKGVSAGFGTQMGVGALQGAKKAYDTGDPGAAVTAALQAVMAGLSAAHATGATDVLNEYLQRQATKEANAPLHDANAVNALRPPQPEAQPAAPVQPGRPIVPTEPGTSRPPFVGTPTPEVTTKPTTAQGSPSVATYYHGGAETYSDLKPGNGVDGEGIYLANDRNRAVTYGKRDASGVDRTPHITQVDVDTTGKKIWDDTAQYDLRNFTNAPWLDDLINKYGEKSAIMSGQNARVYLGFKDTAKLKELGYAGIKGESDFIVLDPSIIKYSGPERTAQEATATAKAPDITAPPQVPPVSPQQVAGSPAQPAGEPLPPEANVPPVDLNDIAKKHFGTTTNPNEAGYVLTDGSMLDFSGRHEMAQLPEYMNGKRNIDHRELPDSLTGESKNINDDIYTYQRNSGSLRVNYDGNNLNANFTNHLSPAQMVWVEKWGEGGNLTLERTNPADGRPMDSVEIDTASKAQIRKGIAKLNTVVPQETPTVANAAPVQGEPTNVQPEAVGSANRQGVGGNNQPEPGRAAGDVVPGEANSAGRAATEVPPETKTGTPINVRAYHGSEQNFDTVEPQGLGAHFTGDKTLAQKMVTDNSKSANVHEADISIQKPLRIQDHGGDHNEASVAIPELVKQGVLPKSFNDGLHERLLDRQDALIKSGKSTTDAWVQSGREEMGRAKDYLKSQGYDGLVYDNKAEGGGDSYVVFDKSQIKPTSPKTGTPENPTVPVNPSKRVLKMSEQEAVAEALHLSLPERKSMSEKQGDVIDAAMANYHDILSTLKNYDPAEHETLTRAERVVAAVHQGDLADRLTKLLNEADKNPADKTKQAQIDALTAELSHVGKMIYRSGSEAGRNLAFQKAILPDPTSAAAVLQRADTLTQGEVSPLVRQVLLRKVEEAQNLKTDLDTKTEAKAVEAEKQVRQGTNQSAKGIPKFGENNTIFTSARAEAARARLKEKMGRASAGFDPTALADIVEIGGYYFEGGVRKFSDWADKIRSDAPGIDYESLRKAWTQVVSNPDIKGRKPITVADVKARAEKTLSGLGKPPKPKPTQPQIDIATAEYAKGANSLNAFARSIEKRFGQKMEPQEIQNLFTEAAKKYRLDYKQLDAIKGDMAKVIAKAAYNSRPGWQKLGININEAANVGRTLITSFDMSGLLRQGGFLSQANPRAAIPAVRDMFKAARSEEGANAIDAEIRSRKNAEDYDKSKLFLSEVGEAAPKLSDREEGFVSHVAGKIPGVQSSERAYSTVLNRLRADTYDRLTNDLEKRGTKATDEEKAQIANFINKASGRGSLGEAGNAAGVLLSKVFFSPRYLASRVQMLAGEPIISASGNIIKGGTTRQLVAREYARYLITVGTIIGLSTAGGAKVEKDPRSSDFLTLRFGNVEVDPLSGFKQVVVFGTRMLTGQTKQQNGTIADLSNPKTPLSPTRISTIERFGRSKLAPAFGAAYDVMDRDKKQAARQKFVIGKDFIGRPVTPASMLRNNLLPIGVNNVYEGLRDQGMTPQNARDLMISFGLDTFGMGSNVRDRAQEARERKTSTGSGVSYESPKF